MTKMPSAQSIQDDILGAAKLAPLAASILAPLATLLNIPALSQQWYAYEGTSLPDPRGTVILSAVSLALTVVANALLVTRFSKAQKRWRLLTTLSTFTWTLTTAIAIANLIVFGKTRQHGPDYSYLEGFWCAIWAVILSGSCAAFLLFHFFVEIGRPPEDEIQVRLTGGHFMRSIIALMATVAVEALIFSKVEGWEFFDGVYFAVVTMLTIGFGDLAPTQAATRVLLVPFALATISMLANQVSMIVEFISAIADVRRQKWRAEYTKREEEKFGDDGTRPAELQDEVNFLNKLGAKEENLSQMFDLATSLATLLVFWFVGAIIFGKMEGWSYGVSLYFCYVFFLTLGYGDYAPKTPAGRTFFVLYSLLAVPIIASFALQTVSNIVTSITERRFNAQKLKEEQGDTVLKPHADFVLEHHKTLDREFESLKAKQGKEEGSDPIERIFEKKLQSDLISLACSMEAQARRIMMNQLPEGSQPQVLLRADRNQQLRDMRSIGVEESSLKAIMDEEDSGDDDLLKQTIAYRETFAKFLATGSRLRSLQGVQQEAFERRRGEAGEDTGDGTVKTGGNMSLSGFVDGQENAKGAGGRSDNLDDGGDKKEAREKQDKDGGPSTGAQKALNIASV